MVSASELSPTPPPRRRSAKQASVALVIAAAVGMVAPHTEVLEGKRNRAYLDPAKVPTYCFGETEDVDWSRIYGDDECSHRLRLRMGRDYAPRILACVPAFAEPRRLRQFAWSIDAAYNAGWRAVCRSPMAAKFNAGDWAGGCRAFVGWYVHAGRPPRVLPGLVKRRQAEARGCLSGDLSR